jgi:hypothetical protein
MILARETQGFKSEALLGQFQVLLERVQRRAHEGTAIHQVEGALFRDLLAMGLTILGEFVRIQGSGDQGATTTLPEGRTLNRLDHLRERTYRSIFGDLTLKRFAYGTRDGQKIELVPLDTRLQLPAGDYSYVLQDWAQAFGMEQAWLQVQALLAKILGFDVPVDSLERMNHHMAEEVESFRQQQPVPEPVEEGAIFVVGGDGKGIPMRRTADEPKPGPHRQKGEKANKKRMAIVGTVYSVNHHRRTPQQVVAALFEDGSKPEEDRPLPCHKHLWACLTYDEGDVHREGLSEVFGWLADELTQRNPNQAQTTVCLMDGQESLWAAQREYLPPQCIEVLDLMHVMPRLWEAAHVFHKEGSGAAEQFVRDRLLRVLRGESLYVRIGLRQMATKHGLTGKRRHSIDRICNYLEANAGRMGYDWYLAAGYPIASGVLEGACRHYVKDRMERSGMRWTQAGAQAMLDVRSRWVNGDWKPFQAFRIKRETARLHPYRKLVGQMEWPIAA